MLAPPEGRTGDSHAKGICAERYVVDVTILADGARWAVLATLSVAAVEKVITIATHSAQWHPVIVANGLRRIANGVIATALTLDVVGVLLLAVIPRLGALLSLPLLLGYSIAGARVQLDGKSDCACTWRLLSARTVPSFFARNAALVSLAMVATIRFQTSSVAGFAAGLAVLAGISIVVAAIDRLYSVRSGRSPGAERLMEMGSDAVTVPLGDQGR